MATRTTDTPERFVDARGARAALVVLGACFAAHVVLSTPLWMPRLDAPCTSERLYVRALCASEAGPESPTQLGAAAASHAIQLTAVALLLLLAWRARKPHDAGRSVTQLATALALIAGGAVAIYASWNRLSPVTAVGAQAVIMAAMVLAGRRLVRPPYAFGIIAFGTVASALIVGGPLGIVVGAMTDQLDRWWPTAWSLAGVAIAGVLGTVGPALALVTAFVHPDRGAAWDHLHHR